jgi:hypothetical protein
MSWLLDNPEKEYIESVKTDVMKTWRKFGFVPPSELKGRENALENLHQMQDRKAVIPVQSK